MVKTGFSLVAAIAAVFLFCFPAARSQASVGQDPFPVYECIRANVAFWKKVYAEYPTSKGLIHDNRDLSIIYEVVDLAPEDQSGAREINRGRAERAKEKYRQILLGLAGGRPAQAREEKRVLDLLGGSPSPARLAQAAEAVRFQQCLKDRFIEGLVRSGSYLTEIKRIFRGYDLPEDLAYLPHVESSFNYKAYSKFGAAGIWQFTESTGKRFMTIDYALDERRDPIRASHAAARFLKENHSRLGSWPLALTAYNHGPSGMMRAKNQLGSYENIFTNYDGELFGFASRNFYSEFIAAREVAKNYRRYFGNVTVAAPVSFVEVAIPGYAPVKDLSRHFQVDLATLKELNPGLRPPVFEGRKHVPRGYKLRLPGKNGEATRFTSTMADETFADKQQRSRFYQVKKGDSAGGIAIRHGVKLEDLMEANGLNARATVYVGQNLRIPIREEKVVLLAKAETRAEDIAPAKDEVARKEEREIVTLKADTVKKMVTPLRKEEPAPQVPAPASPAEQVAAVVAEKPPQEGKQVETAAAAPVVAAAEEPETQETVAEEQQAELQPGGGVAELPKAAVDEPEFNPEVVTGDLLVADVHTVKGRAVGSIRVEVGETLSHFADWLRLSTGSIRRLNGLRFGQPINIGQPLKIEFAKVSKEDFEEKRYEYHKEIEEDFFAVYKIEGAKLYRIKAGDNIWRLCQDEFDLPLWLVWKFNTAHDFNNLKLDEQLIIPVVGEIAPQ